jgi:hypothetical protein
MLLVACVGAAFRSEPAAVAAPPRAVAPHPRALAIAREEASTPAVQAEKTEERPDTGELPARPSHGAIVSALRAVLPDARACLGPDDPVYRATVTFDGTGAVSGVSFASEDDGSACVRAHLADARVAPFADAPFVATVNVRP